MKRIFHILLALVWVSPGFCAEKPKKEPRIPSGLDFIRSFDSELFVQRENNGGAGNQTLRLRTRYLDPDVNAFVGMQTSVNHFNVDLQSGEPGNIDTSAFYWDWGINLGLVRGRHLWEVELQGETLASLLGFAPAIVGEHRLNDHWLIYHRFQTAFLPGDTIVDADQGIYWMHSWWGISAGYRLFAAKHMSRSGPRIGIRLRFESPKIPFLFPSLG